ncbi:hypothetical protein BLNAU_6174 [Blattamonas nauphoetae]|uniref:Uncharacterized protein n=1 Tax=Blattamonas nauphoetae TaxID=2049346 RepID=A0ABQ9Y5G0_9EUKA|nr:hypothetical protein BLNAU_6174 [Blattamonas nauphoetae]
MGTPTGCPKPKLDFTRMLDIDFAGCLVNALHSTTTLPHSFPFFSPELCRLSEQPSVWNNSSRPSALTALTTLADIEISLAYGHSLWGRNLSREDETRRDINFLHLFPFLGTDSKSQFLSSFGTFCKSMNRHFHSSIDRMVEFLVEMATVNSVNTPIALLTEMRKVKEAIKHTNPGSLYFGQQTRPQSSQFETSIVEKLRTAEGEERWRLLTQLVVVSRDTPDIANELMRAESDAQALFLLSVHKIRSTTRIHFLDDSTFTAFDRFVELAGHINNLPLVEATLAHVGDTVRKYTNLFHTNRLFNNQRRQELSELVFNTLRAITLLRREGVEDGCAVGKDDVTSQIVASCLEVLRFLMKFESFDPTPVIDSLVSLAVTTDLSLLRSILEVLQMIEDITRNTPTPFSISRATAPFRGIHEASVTQQPLPSIVSHILLSLLIESQSSTGFIQSPNV